MVTFPKVIPFHLLVFVCQVGVIWSGFPCLRHPCLNGICIDYGLINSTRDHRDCFCIDGFTGYSCQINWDECNVDPCQNGGTCIDGIASFNCSCPENFAGVLCEYDLSDCPSYLSCEHNGTCQFDPGRIIPGKNGSGFYCACPSGFRGELCQEDISVCNSTQNVCLNGGRCIDDLGEKFSCECAPGWVGQFCQVNLDECSSAPCQNGGICVDGVNDYACACQFSYTGKQCELKMEFCPVNPCQNGGLCLVEGGVNTCFCVPDYHGKLCEERYNECEPAPKCFNGGTCIDGVGGFNCSCPEGVWGSTCQCTPDNSTAPECQDGPWSTPSPGTNESITLTPPPFWSSTVTTKVYPTPSPTPADQTQRVGSDELDTPEPTPTPTMSTDLVEDVTPSVTPTRSSDQVEPTATPDIASSLDPDLSTTVTAPGEEPSLTTTWDVIYPTPTMSMSDDIDMSSTTVLPTPSDWNSVSFTPTPSSPIEPPSPSPTVTGPWDEVTPPLETEPTSTTEQVTPGTVTGEEEVTSPVTPVENVTLPEADETTTEGLTSSSEGSTQPSTPVTGNTTEEHEGRSDGHTGSDTVKQTTPVTEGQSSTPVTEESSNVGNETEGPVTPTMASDEPTTSTGGTPTSGSSTGESSTMTPRDDAGKGSTTPSGDDDKSSTTPSGDDDKSSTTPSGDDDKSSTTPSGDDDKSSTTPEPSSPSGQTERDLVTGTSTDGSGGPTENPATPVTGRPTSSSPSSSEESEPPTSTTAAAISTIPPINDPCLNYCQNDAKCIPNSPEPICICRFKFTGRRCELVSEKVTVPAFRGNSYLRYKVRPKSPRNLVDMSLRMATVVPDGLVLYTSPRASSSGHVTTTGPGQGSDDDARSSVVGGRSYALIFIQNGHLVLHFSCGSQSMEFVETRTRVNNGFNFTLDLSLTLTGGPGHGNGTAEDLVHCLGKLSVNGSDFVMSGEQLVGNSSLSTFETVLVGGVSSTVATVGSKVDDVLAFVPGFRGCLFRVMIGSEERDMYEEAVDGQEIMECETFACVTNPCFGAAKCIPSLRDPFWECICPMGYVGRRCQIKQCLENPCKNGATCSYGRFLGNMSRSLGSVPGQAPPVTCLCPLGFSGVSCEARINITKPSFHPTEDYASYISYYGLPYLTDWFQMKFHFVPTNFTQIGLLVYMGNGGRGQGSPSPGSPNQVDQVESPVPSPESSPLVSSRNNLDPFTFSPIPDFFSLSFLQGYLGLTWNLGSGTQRIVTPAKVDPRLQIHTITFGRAGRQAWLKVDGMRNITGKTPGPMFRLNVDEELYVGGHPAHRFEGLPHDLPLHMGFQGCIFDLGLRAKNRLLLPKPFKGRNVKNCFEDC